jgi:hypothetical protein
VTSPAESVPAVLRALEQHRRHVLTLSEVAARSGLDDDATAAAVAALATRGAVVVREIPTPDPHLPALVAVALVEDRPDGPAEAARRSDHHAALMQRRLLRSHRCL